MNHPPTPWKLAGHGVTSQDIGNAKTLTCIAYGITPDEVQANAAFIVRACNAHNILGPYVYIISERGCPHDLYTVGFYDPDGTFHPESDHMTGKTGKNGKESAAARVAYLNGERHGLPSHIIEALNSGDGSYRP